MLLFWTACCNFASTAIIFLVMDSGLLSMGKLCESIKLFTDIKYCRTSDEYSDSSDPTWTLSDTDSVPSSDMWFKRLVCGRKHDIADVTLSFFISYALTSLLQMQSEHSKNVFRNELNGLDAVSSGLSQGKQVLKLQCLPWFLIPSAWLCSILGTSGLSATTFSFMASLSQSLFLPARLR